MTDLIHDQLTEYTLTSAFGALSADVVDAAKSRVLDTLGALVAGFGGEPCSVLRRMARGLYPGPGATIIGTTMSAPVDMAAMVNATASRYAELNDTYHIPGKPGVHPSDVIMPLVSLGEHLASTGPELLTAVVAAYEVCLAMAEAAPATGFDNTNFVAMGVAVGSAILLELTEDAIRQCISLVAVSGNALLRSRRGAASAWKSAASGHAGRAGVFAAQLAGHGMGAPSLPFSGTAGWLEVVARQDVELALPAPPESRRLLGTIIKPRAACGAAIPAVLAAEAAHRQGIDIGDITEVVVQTYRDAYRKNAVGVHHWAPSTRETADHSIPYVVAAALMDGTVGPTQYDDRHLNSDDLRELLAKVRVEESDEFTEAYDAMPVVHRTRVTVSVAGGDVILGDSGGAFGDIADPMSNDQITAKFAGIVTPVLGRSRVDQLVGCVGTLDRAHEIGSLIALLADMETADDQH